jgi:uncharacterized membrane protein YeiH
MDVVGATTVAFVTAFGGGTLRDLLLGRTPIFWVVDPGLSVITFVVAFVSYYLIDQLSDRALLVPDALGLGLFSIIGVSLSLQMQIPALVSALLGVVTGVFGGISRDVLCNRIPAIFQRNTELYATCAFIGAWVFILLRWLQVAESVAAWLGVTVIFLLRLFAVRFNMKLRH